MPRAVSFIRRRSRATDTAHCYFLDLSAQYLPNLQTCFADLGHMPGAFPVAEAAARESLAIPIYGELTEARQATVVSSLRAFSYG